LVETGTPRQGLKRFFFLDKLDISMIHFSIIKKIYMEKGLENVYV
jgi:hypothetical protein